VDSNLMVGLTPLKSVEVGEASSAWGFSAKNEDAEPSGVDGVDVTDGVTEGPGSRTVEG
jgi:hypothetical protein